ncbi:olfactory receptor 6F1-like [Bombina bombina]|uniref:olfactory receptor 6F1-like n=1 Tax=Bombina bombina TaxID=8345 RepID=UPI00235AB9F0|nr:olfactory receptor 6F1-like [Bombina bombina]
MHKDNHTMVIEFILLGFHDLHNFQILLFLFLIVMYAATIAGNVLIIVLVTTFHQFHIPMYIFLCHLSLADILISTNVAPKALQVILLGRSSTPAGDCITQLYFFGVSAIIECCLLTVMSYDRYLAICKPLHYTTIMNIILPHILALWCWVAGFVFAGIPQFLISELDFCGPNEIDHFFCDLAPVLELSCSDTSRVQIEVSIVVIVMCLLQFFYVIATYVCIFSSILQISSITGRHKAFSTCSSHLTVVCIYYGTLIVLYVSPSRGYSLNFNKALSFLNTAVTPLFNPIIYSLRNKDIRETIQNVISHKITPM